MDAIYIQGIIRSTSGAGMALNVTNQEADALTRAFAEMEGISLTEAIVVAMKEAIARRQGAETPRETAARLRAKHGVVLDERARTPLPRDAFDALWED